MSYQQLGREVMELQCLHFLTTEIIMRIILEITRPGTGVSALSALRQDFYLTVISQGQGMTSTGQGINLKVIDISGTIMEPIVQF